MIDYKYILFDFDGTIVDTGRGIKNSISFALNSLNFKIPDEEFLNKFIGPPLTVSFDEFCNFDKEKTDKAVKLYRNKYNEKGIYEIDNYKGVEDVLKYLKDKNKKIIIATSKPDFFAKKILENVNLLSYFDFVAGSTLDGKRNSKIEVIEYAINTLKIDNLSKAIMIGDRKFDILGAKHFGIDSIGVLYGYGSKGELREAGATYLAKTPDSLKNILI